MNHAKEELEALQRVYPNDELIITPFIPAVMALVEAFRQSGQSGGSAPFTIQCIVDTLKRLMAFQPLCDLQDTPEEWNNISDFSDDPVAQNRRDSRVFKSRDGTISFIDAIIWEDEEGRFSGRVGKLHSLQPITLPCTPKTRYVKVTRVPTEDPDDWQYKITDPKEEEELNALYHV